MLEPLRPSETVQRVLISSTARFVGDFNSPALNVDHAWPYFGDRSASLRMSEGPYSRNAFVVSFRTEQTLKRAGMMVPDYHSIGDLFSAFSSLLYGKRFDNHGSLVNMGSFRLPNLISFESSNNHFIPQNRHEPRLDISIPLHIKEVERFINLFTTRDLNKPPLSTFITACRFYLRALQNTEVDIEVAYLNLITAGEIISNAFVNDHSILIDDETRSVLGKIEAGMDNGKKIANFIQGKLRSIKRKFVHTLCSLVDEEFFSRTDPENQHQSLDKTSFEKRVSAAYDIRSRYVHTGMSFGGWIRPSHSDNNGEIQFGKPVVDDRDLQVVLELAPTYIGLERIIRYVLLRYADQAGFMDVAFSPIEAVTVE